MRIFARFIVLQFALIIPLMVYADDQSIINAANKVLQTEPVAVTDKSFSISGNPHNFESLSIYWWPNPQNPTGPYIAKDGQANPEHKQYDLPRLMKMVDNLQKVGKAYIITKDSKYYDFFCKQLDVWFINDETKMLPNFNYCQFIPGRNNGKGNPQGMIDSYNFNSIIENINKVNAIQPIGNKRLKALKRWMKNFASWMENSDNGKVASRYKNNQGIAYDTTLFNIYRFAGNDKKCSQVIQSCCHRIKQQIDNEGKQPEELKRTRAYFYSIWNLQHIVEFLTYANDASFDIDNETRRKVCKSIQYLEQFIGHKEKFPYKDISADWNENERLLSNVRTQAYNLEVCSPIDSQE